MPYARRAPNDPDRPMRVAGPGTSHAPLYSQGLNMLQKLVLAIAIFLIILVALTFGESVAQNMFAWISHITGVVIYSFSDIYQLIRDYIRIHTGKVVLAIVLTVPIWLWVLRSKGDQLRTPHTNRKIAIVLAVFLGWLGAHRFYIGQIG